MSVAGGIDTRTVAAPPAAVRGRLGFDIVGLTLDVSSERRTPVGLPNHPATNHMATTRLCSTTTTGLAPRGSWCPSDSRRAVAGGTVPPAHPLTGDPDGGSTARGPHRRVEHATPGPTRSALRSTAVRAGCRRWGRTKCGCARRDHEQGDGGQGFDSPRLHLLNGREREVLAGGAAGGGGVVHGRTSFGCPSPSCAASVNGRRRRPASPCVDRRECLPGGPPEGSPSASLEAAGEGTGRCRANARATAAHGRAAARSDRPRPGFDRGLSGFDSRRLHWPGREAVRRSRPGLTDVAARKGAAA